MKVVEEESESRLKIEENIDSLIKIFDKKHRKLDGCSIDGIDQIPLQHIYLAPICNYLRSLLSSKDFSLLPPTIGSEERLPIASMYVELAVTKQSRATSALMITNQQTISQEQEERHARRRARRVSIEQAVNDERHNHVVILGDPGSGKTSLMKYLTLEVAKNQPVRWRVPAFISLPVYWEHKKRHPEITLLHYFAVFIYSHNESDNLPIGNSLLIGSAQYQRLLPELEAIEGSLLRLSGDHKEHILFILDGMDEISSIKEARQSITEDIRELGRRFSWVVSSRHAGFYGGIEDDCRYDLVGLHNEAILSLTDNWFRRISPENASENVNSLIEQIKLYSTLEQMARNPFLLTLLCLLQYRSGRPLPLQRSEIYRQIIDLTGKQLRFKNRDDSLFGAKEQKYLADFCLFLYTDAERAPRQLFGLDTWTEFESSNITPDLNTHFLSTRLITSWDKQSDYHFVHLTFQEYFVAKSIANSRDIYKHIYKPHWRVITRFVAGIYWTSGKKDRYVELLRSIVHDIDLFGQLYVEAAWILVEAGVQDSTPIIGKDLREQLWRYWLKDQPYIQDAAAEALAILSPDYLLSKVYSILEQNDTEEVEYDTKAIQAHFIRFGTPPRRNLKLSAIRLLGKLKGDEADDLLVKLLMDSSQKFVDSAIEAISEKNTPSLREKILSATKKNLSISNSENVAKLIRKIGGQDFAPWLIKQIQLPIDDNDRYNYHYMALETIGAFKFQNTLCDIIESYGSSPPLGLLSAYISLKTDTVIKWVRKHIETEGIDSRLTIFAAEHGLLSETELLYILKNTSGALRQGIIEVIEDQGAVCSHQIAHAIGEIAFADGVDAESAYRALVRLETLQWKKSPRNTFYREEYRKYLSQPENVNFLETIVVLGSIEDVVSFDQIINIAHGRLGSRSAQINAVIALGNFKEIFQSQSIRELHQIIEFCDEKEDVGLLETALDTLGSLDFRELERYTNLAATMKSKARVAADQGLLFFESGYVDHNGERFEYPSSNNVRRPNITYLSLPDIDEPVEPLNYQKELRIVVNALIDNVPKIASLGGKYLGSSNTIRPLSNDGKHTNGTYIDSISTKSLSRFRDGNDLAEAPFLKLWGWVTKTFPEVIKWAEESYEGDLSKHKNHAIIWAAFSVNKNKER